MTSLHVPRGLPAVCLACLVVGSLFAGDADPEPDGEAAKYGIQERIPWTTSRIKGSPDPPSPYRADVAFPKLQFTRPVILTNAPGTDRLFLAELLGKLYSFPNDEGTEKPDAFYDLSAHNPPATAVYGLTFHPNFANNRYCYICYIVGANLPDGTRVSRFKVTDSDPPTIVAGSEQVIITWVSGGHNGGCLKFGPDGMLYIATGDATSPSPPDALGTGQDCSDLLSSILRIDVDNPADGKAYSVPADNPFVGREGIRPEIWAYGFRNPWKMSFDRQTGDLWTGDVGWELWEMVYRVERGGNYGWSVMEGRQPVRPEGKRGPTPIVPPVVDHPHTEAASITGGFVYRGRELANLVGAYIYGDYVSGKIWGLRYDGSQAVWHQELVDTPLQIIGFAETGAGELFLMDYDRTGRIYRLLENPARSNTDEFPRKLSYTGLFASVKDHVPAPGVLAYSVNAEMWSDHALSERFVALPDASTVECDVRGVQTFPQGAVFSKTISLEMRVGDPASRRRLETQVLHYEGDSWRAYTYVWNDDQSDATLADADGFERTYAIADPASPTGRREQTWRFAGRAECALCHNPRAGSVLAFTAEQLDRDYRYAPACCNQLATLQHVVVIKIAQPRRRQPVRVPLVDPHDAAAELNRRARSYLHVNCGHCHRRGGGGTAVMRLTADLELEQTDALDVRPTQGAFGIAGGKIIATGDPFASVLYYRMAKLGAGRMPRIGARMIDERGLALVYDWMGSLGGEQGNGQGESIAPHQTKTAALAILQDARPASDEAVKDAVTNLTASTRGALTLLHALGDEQIPRQRREQIVSLATQSSATEVRDLFERFLPEAQRTKRLGAVVKPDELLALAGDRDRGRELFFHNQVVRCKSCHRINGVGETLGPDLSEIGKKHAPPAMLDAILDPSREIDTKYVSYVLETSDGEILAGLLENKDAREVVLRDAGNKLLRVPAANVELLVPGRKSIMPELLLQDLTAQEVADLLAFLCSLK